MNLVKYELMKQNPKPQDFIERSNLRGFTVLFLDWAAIFGIIIISVWMNNWIVYLISVWAIGSFQYAIGESLFHEASHYNLFKTKKINDYLEWIYAVPFFVDMTQYRKEHLDHHHKSGTELDHIVRDYNPGAFSGSGRTLKVHRSRRHWSMFSAKSGWKALGFKTNCSMKRIRTGCSLLGKA